MSEDHVKLCIETFCNIFKVGSFLEFLMKPLSCKKLHLMVTHVRFILVFVMVIRVHFCYNRFYISDTDCLL